MMDLEKGKIVQEQNGRSDRKNHTGEGAKQGRWNRFVEVSCKVSKELKFIRTGSKRYIRKEDTEVFKQKKKHRKSWVESKYSGDKESLREERKKLNEIKRIKERSKREENGEN